VNRHELKGSCQAATSPEMDNATYDEEQEIKCFTLSSSFSSLQFWLRNIVFHIRLALHRRVDCRIFMTQPAAHQTTVYLTQS
jgi:hypothetical protein